MICSMRNWAGIRYPSFLRPTREGCRGMRRPVLLLASLGFVVLLASGAALAVTEHCNVNRCVGTNESDRLLGNDRPNWMVGRDGNDTLKGFLKPDYLYGSGGNDTLVAGRSERDEYGDTDRDYLYGGPGNDTLKGSHPDADSYYFRSASWGRDTIMDERSSCCIWVNEVRFQKISSPLIINLTSDPSSPEVRSAVGTSTVNWSNDAVDAVKSGHGNDIITVSDASEAKDTIIASGGDDTVHVNDGVGDDGVDCGGGTDTVFYDPGDGISDNCEVQNPPVGE